MLQQAVKKTNLVDQVQDQIIEHIKLNRLSIGDNLPKEIELQEVLGVSRTIIREALSRLKMVGLLESKKKRGLVITEPKLLTNYQNVFQAEFLRERTLKDLFELRLIMEVGMTDLLFRRKTPVILKELESLVSMEKKVKTEKKRVELDMQFHTTLYRLSGNTMLEDFQKLLSPFFHAIEKKYGKPEHQDPSKQVTHTDILNELSHGTPTSLRNAIQQHLSPYFSIFG